MLSHHYHRCYILGIVFDLYIQDPIVPSFQPHQGYINQHQFTDEDPVPQRSYTTCSRSLSREEAEPGNRAETPPLLKSAVPTQRKAISLPMMDSFFKIHVLIYNNFSVKSI